jgi:hypothetical protein
MMDNRFEVTAGAGTMMSGFVAAVRFRPRRIPGGVTVEAGFTGGHLLHLVAAGCVLDDLYREAASLGIELHGFRVTVAGRFDPATWQFTSVGYSAEFSSSASADQLAHLLKAVDQVMVRSLTGGFGRARLCPSGSGIGAEKGRRQAGTGSQQAPGPARWQSERADFLCLGALLSPTGGVGDPLVLLQAAEAVSLDGGVMDEHVGGSVVGGDEAVALVGVEPLDSAFSHVLLL